MLWFDLSDFASCFHHQKMTWITYVCIFQCCSLITVKSILINTEVWKWVISSCRVLFKFYKPPPSLVGAVQTPSSPSPFSSASPLPYASSLPPLSSSASPRSWSPVSQGAVLPEMLSSSDHPHHRPVPVEKNSQLLHDATLMTRFDRSHIYIACMH